MNRVVKLIALAAAAGTLFGCAGPTFIVQQYPGPVRARETIAILRSNASDDAKLLLLDEQDIAAPIAEDGRLHIEILPARHDIIVGRASAPGERYPSVAFTAEADHVYRVAFAGTEPHVYEVDRSKDALGRDVTIYPTPPVVPTLPPAPAPLPTPLDADAGAPSE